MAAIEVNSGFYVLDDAGLLSNPRGDSVAVLQRHTRNGRVAGHLYVYRGGQWRDVAYDDRSFYVDPVNGVNATNRGKSRDNPFLTITYALSQAVGGKDEVIYCEPGSYNEAVTINKDNITLVGLGAEGGAAIAPSAAGGIAVTIEGTAANRTQEVALVNIGMEGNGAGGGLHVKGNIRRIRVSRCKMEGGTFATKLESTAAGSVGDTRIVGCELAWTVTALHFVVSGAGDPVTQTRFQNNLLHNYTSRGIHVDTVHSADLWVLDNTFARVEAGTEPTNEYLLAAVASTSGLMAGNRFPAAAASAKISVAAATFIKGGNSYSDGWAA